jgi:hypothetical protein
MHGPLNVKLVLDVAVFCSRHSGAVRGAWQWICVLARGSFIEISVIFSNVSGIQASSAADVKSIFLSYIFNYIWSSHIKVKITCWTHNTNT